MPKEPTDAQLAAAYKAFNAIFSKYEVDGNTLTGHELTGSNPNVKEGNFMKMEYKLEGDTFWVTPKENEEG